MTGWNRLIQETVDEIDRAIRAGEDEALTLRALSRRLGYSEYHTTRRFRAISGMALRDYLRGRRLAFALREVRDGERALLEIALDYGFSSQEAFTRAFKAAYGVAPGAYRRNPRPVVLRTRLHPFDRYFFGLGEIGMVKSEEGVRTYLVTIPAHSLLHVSNCESNGYWDFWQRQNLIPGQDYETVCGLLSSIKGKLDDCGGDGEDAAGGQIMGYINDPAGRLCDWGIPRVECWGVRLPADWQGEAPEQMTLTRVPEGEYIVFEHGPFDSEQENAAVEERVERAMRAFDYGAAGFHIDTAPGRIMYFYYVPGQYFRYVRPIVRE